MTKERWQEIKVKIKNNFSVEAEYIEDLEPGEAEVLEFDGPQGKMKVRFVTKPKMLDKKTMYSNRPGADIKVDYVYSEDEFVSYLEVFVWSEPQDDWQKLEGDSLFEE